MGLRDRELSLLDPFMDALSIFCTTQASNAFLQHKKIHCIITKQEQTKLNLLVHGIITKHEVIYGLIEI